MQKKKYFFGAKNIHLHVICYVFMTSGVLRSGEKCRNTFENQSPQRNNSRKTAIQPILDASHHQNTTKQAVMCAQYV